MKRCGAVMGIFVLGWLTSACGGGDKAVADFAYEVRCGQTSGCFGLGARQFRAKDGQDDLSISCEVNELNDDSWLLEFSVQSAEYGLRVRDLAVPKAGGAPTGTSCRVTVRENTDNLYEGPCGASIQPCSLTGVSFSSGGVQGNLVCTGIPSVVDQTQVRDITATGSGNQGTPFQFRFTSCAGL